MDALARPDRVEAFSACRISSGNLKAWKLSGGADIRHGGRDRFYVRDIAYATDCLKAYSDGFKNVRLIITMVEVKTLARADRMVEVEADAFVCLYPTSRLTEQRPI
jgi:hypothetical protein